jgi:hypothetical protein
MLIWSFCFLCLFLALGLLVPNILMLERFFGFQRETISLSKVISLLQEFQELLESGVVPSQQRWVALQKLPSPWGGLAFESLQELRSQGGSLVPTLRRIRTLAEEQRATLKEARARSSQALAQAFVCAGLVPLFGCALYYLLPGVSERFWVWSLACVCALALSAGGGLWLLGIADAARWGGLELLHRPWILAAQCAGERFLALLRSGVPADLAWTRSCELLAGQAPELAMIWGHSVWSSSEVSMIGRVVVIAETGSAIKKAIHVSLMEGRSCMERVEGLLMAFRKDFRAQVERELTLLSTRALKPLFICVAPALIGLLALGLFLGWEQAMGDWM